MGIPKDRALKVAVFSGNYNYVRDGANQALNQLVRFLESQNVQVRVYSPTTSTPAFAPAGTLVSVPSWPLPYRSEYRVALGLPRKIRADLDAFAPDLLHLAAPDLLGHAALRYGRARNLPVVASVHTRFETYLRYYGLGLLQPLLLAQLRRFYQNCRQIYAPSPCMAETLAQQDMSSDIRLWSRGIDRSLFNPQHRQLEWRRAHGIADAEVVIGFVGRIVLEKGLDVFASVLAQLEARGLKARALVVGDGPARSWFEQKLKNGLFTGFLQGQELAKAYANMDIFLNPSVTETFGNVTLEAMASGLPTVCAQATGSRSLVAHGISGILVPPDNLAAYADALTLYITDSQARQRAGMAGLARAQAYDWTKILGQVLNNYNDALVARRQPLALAIAADCDPCAPLSWASTRLRQVA